MAKAVRFSFSGRLDTRQWDVSLEREHDVVPALQERSTDIAREISDRIASATGVPPTVLIDFEEGSVEWFGSVEWVQAAWPTLEAMSTVGGAIGLIQIVRAAVDSVLRRWFNRFFGRPGFSVSPGTRVVIISGPVSTPSSVVGVVPWTMFGTAAVLVGLAALVYAIGYAGSVIR